MKCSVEEEYEANEFAHMILHPSISSKAIRWFDEHKKASIIGIAIIVVVCIGLIGIPYALRQQSCYGEYYITDSGHKYHEKECIFVKDKNNVERLTQEQYYSGEYEPCQICLPEGN